jgi:hypothetical protein
MTTIAANLHRNPCPKALKHALQDRPTMSRSSSRSVAVNTFSAIGKLTVWWMWSSIWNRSRSTSTGARFVVDPGAGRLTDVDLRLPGAGRERDHFRTEGPRLQRVEVSPIQLLVTGDPLVTRLSRAVITSTRAGPVLGCDDPLDRRQVPVGHADETLADQCGLPCCLVPEADRPGHRRGPDVVLMPVVQDFHAVQAERIVVLDPQLEHQPVRQVDQVLVEHRATAQDGGLPVEATVGVGTRIVHCPPVLPLGGAAGADIAVPGRGQCLTQPFLFGCGSVVRERPAGHGEPLFSLVEPRQVPVRMRHRGSMYWPPRWTRPMGSWWDVRST